MKPYAPWLVLLACAIGTHFFRIAHPWPSGEGAFLTTWLGVIVVLASFAVNLIGSFTVESEMRETARRALLRSALAHHLPWIAGGVVGAIGLLLVKHRGSDPNSVTNTGIFVCLPFAILAPFVRLGWAWALVRIEGRPWLRQTLLITAVPHIIVYGLILALTFRLAASPQY